MRILYIDIDSQRPDHLGCYGYHRNTSPAIDRIASEGVVFQNVYASDAPCLPSRTALYSGRFGIQTGVVGHGGTAAEPKRQGANRNFRDHFDEQGLARQLQKLGYHTAMVSPFGQRHAAHWFYAGFNEIHNTGMGGMESAEHVMPVVRDWLGANVAKDHWYLHVNFWDPHTPYRAPEEYGEPFKDAPLPAWLEKKGVLEKHLKMTGPHTALDFGGMYDDRTEAKYPRHPGKITDLASLRRVIDGYDTGVKYADDQVGEIVAALKKAGVYEDTAIIISADHGENLGELGIYGEHGTADEGTCHIPMIIKWPGGAKGKKENGLHYNIDLAPTLMELLGAPAPKIWDGKSFAQAVKSGAEDGRPELAISQCAHVCQRSIRWENYLYIRSYHDGFHLFPSEMVFDLASDPHEENDLASSRPDLVREGSWRLSKWHETQMNKMAKNGSDVVDPLWTVMSEGGPFHARLAPPPGQPGGMPGFEKYLERLEATGRGEGAKALREKYLSA